MHPKVTVIIPNYNNRRFIAESVESVLQQSYKNVELIVVDDGSTDSSLLELDKYLPRIKIIRQLNSGVAAARNAGILSSTGEFIAFLDSDDVWLPEKLKKQMKILLESSLDLVYCGGKELKNDTVTGITFLPEYEGNLYDYYKKFPTKAIILLGGSTVVFKKSLLTKVGIFNTAVPAPTEDLDFFRRMSKTGIRVGYSSEQLILYRTHESNASRRSLSSYYEGNKFSLMEMFVQDSSIGFIERRNIWCRFQILFVKSFIKEKNFRRALLCLLRIIKPVLL